LLLQGRRALQGCLLLQENRRAEMTGTGMVLPA